MSSDHKTFNYDELAKFYDKIFNKDYEKEVNFIVKIFKRYNVKTILDVGCGTGEHIQRLENLGFKCDGLDISQKMIDIAKKKTKNARFYRADMKNFDLRKKYDAILCMFATFNYNISIHEAKRTLTNFKKHLTRKGLVLLDLHNVWKNGKKEIKNKNTEVIMKWVFNKKTRIEKTNAVFKIGNKVIKDTHTFRIFSIRELKQLFTEVGFKKIIFYENYTLKKPTSRSKNIEVVGLL